MTGKKLLLIEDNTSMRKLLARLLTTAGYQVEEAIDGMSGVYQAHELQPDLVVLDLNLPDIPGIQVIELIAGHPFVVLTIDHDDRHYRICRNRGALGYILKPLDPEALLKTIDLALERANEHRNFDRALRETRNIAKAVGILMGYHRLSEQEAYARLRHYATSQRRKMAEFSGAVIRAMTLLGTPPVNPAASADVLRAEQLLHDLGSANTGSPGVRKPSWQSLSPPPMR